MAATDVITLQQALDAISMTGSGAQHGEMVQTFLSGVSEVMDNVAGPIRWRTVTDELHDPDGSVIELDFTPVVSVTTVTEYVSGAATVLTAEALTTAGDYLLRENLLGRRSGFSPYRWQGRVKVTYVAGRYENLTDVPARYQLACMQIIARMWPQYASAWSRGGGVFDAPEGAVGFFRSVEPVVREVLAGDHRAPFCA